MRQSRSAIYVAKMQHCWEWHKSCNVFPRNFLMDGRHSDIRQTGPCSLSRESAVHPEFSQMNPALKRISNKIHTCIYGYRRVMSIYLNNTRENQVFSEKLKENCIFYDVYRTINSCFSVSLYVRGSRALMRAGHRNSKEWIIFLRTTYLYGYRNAATSFPWDFQSDLNLLSIAHILSAAVVTGQCHLIIH